jgi:DNA recombination protein RmuC
MSIVLALLVGLLLGAAALALVRRSQPAPTYDGAIAATLTRLDTQLHAIEAARERAYGGLIETMRHVHDTSEGLREQTSALVTALRAPHTRGRWGEMQLRRVIEAAGALEHCDFEEQCAATGSSGGVRPDVVVKLAGGKHVVVDAKVPIAAYLESIEAADETTATDRRRAHARQLREHVKALSGKTYWASFDPAPEFVVLFVPADAILDAALAADPTLQEFAFGSDVVLATPSTLVALLRTIAYTWRQETLAAGAREISRLGRELHHRLATMGGHVERLGRSLTSAVDSYNETVGSLEARVLVAARRLGELGADSGDLPSPVPIEATPRRVSAPELTSITGARHSA